MLPTAVPQQELRQTIGELQELLNGVKQHQSQALHTEQMLDSLYRLKAKATEAIELLKEDTAVTGGPTPYQKKLHRLYQRL